MGVLLTVVSLRVSSLFHVVIGLRLRLRVRGRHGWVSWVGEDGGGSNGDWLVVGVASLVLAKVLQAVLGTLMALHQSQALLFLLVILMLRVMEVVLLSLVMLVLESGLLLLVSYLPPTRRPCRHEHQILSLVPVVELLPCSLEVHG